MYGAVVDMLQWFGGKQVRNVAVGIASYKYSLLTDIRASNCMTVMNMFKHHIHIHYSL